MPVTPVTPVVPVTPVTPVTPKAKSNRSTKTATKKSKKLDESHVKYVKPTKSLELPAELRSKCLEILKAKLGPKLKGLEGLDEQFIQLEKHINDSAVKRALGKGIDDCHDRALQSYYNYILSDICLNLCSSTNSYLLPAVLSGSVKLYQLANMNIMELNPKAWGKQIRKNEAAARQVANGPNVLTTSMIKCGKCGSGVSYTETQTRSADEAMTIKATCPKCGNRFNI